MVGQTRNQNSILNMFYQLPRNFIAVFRVHWPWQLAAIAITYVLVVSGFDWAYFTIFRETWFYQASFIAAIVGAFAPILVPLTLYIVGMIQKNSRIVNIGFALAQAAMLGSIVSSIYKSLTGREHPDMIITHIDISRMWNFGFMRGGIFWGWPSSHTTIAFAMSVTLLTLFAGNKKIRNWSLGYAFFIGLSVAISIHWFSDFAAGAIFGSVIGLVVGRSFLNRKIN